MQIYESAFDLEQREAITKKIEEFIENRDQITMLVIGSPDCKEIKNLSEKIKEKINLFVFDFEIKRGKISKNFKKSFNFYEEHSGDFFKNIEKIKIKADFVFHRWFLHHCTDHQKIESFKIIKNLLANDGELLIIDWMIPDYSSVQERWESSKKYYKYQKRHGLDIAKSKQEHNFSKINTPNGKGGKFISHQKLEEIMKKENLEFKREILHQSKVEDPELFGANLYICKEGGN